MRGTVRPATRFSRVEFDRRRGPQGVRKPLRSCGSPNRMRSNLLKSLARRKGFEPLTPRFEVWCSIQLSYRRH
jgi:hypothetical protein